MVLDLLTMSASSSSSNSNSNSSTCSQHFELDHPHIAYPKPSSTSSNKSIITPTAIELQYHHQHQHQYQDQDGNVHLLPHQPSQSALQHDHSELDSFLTSSAASTTMTDSIQLLKQQNNALSARCDMNHLMNNSSERHEMEEDINSQEPCQRDEKEPLFFVDMTGHALAQTTMSSTASTVVAESEEQDLETQHLESIAHNPLTLFTACTTSLDSRGGDADVDVDADGNVKNAGALKTVVADDDGDDEGDDDGDVCCDASQSDYSAHRPATSTSTTSTTSTRPVSADTLPIRTTTSSVVPSATAPTPALSSAFSAPVANPFSWSSPSPPSPGPQTVFSLGANQPTEQTTAGTPAIASLFTQPPQLLPQQFFFSVDSLLDNNSLHSTTPIINSSSNYTRKEQHRFGTDNRHQKRHQSLSPPLSRHTFHGSPSPASTFTHQHQHQHHYPLYNISSFNHPRHPPFTASPNSNCYQPHPSHRLHLLNRKRCHIAKLLGPDRKRTFEEAIEFTNPLGNEPSLEMPGWFASVKRRKIHHYPTRWTSTLSPSPFVNLITVRDFWQVLMDRVDLSWLEIWDSRPPAMDASALTLVSSTTSWRTMPRKKSRIGAASSCERSSKKFKSMAESDSDKDHSEVEGDKRQNSSEEDDEDDNDDDDYDDHEENMSQCEINSLESSSSGDDEMDTSRFGGRGGRICARSLHQQQNDEPTTHPSDDDDMERIERKDRMRESKSVESTNSGTSIPPTPVSAQSMPWRTAPITSSTPGFGIHTVQPAGSSSRYALKPDTKRGCKRELKDKERQVVARLKSRKQRALPSRLEFLSQVSSQARIADGGTLHGLPTPSTTSSTLLSSNNLKEPGTPALISPATSLSNSLLMAVSLSSPIIATEPSIASFGDTDLAGVMIRGDDKQHKIYTMTSSSPAVPSSPTDTLMVSPTNTSSHGRIVDQPHPYHHHPLHLQILDRISILQQKNRRVVAQHPRTGLSLRGLWDEEERVRKVKQSIPEGVHKPVRSKILNRKPLPKSTCRPRPKPLLLLSSTAAAEDSKVHLLSSEMTSSSTTLPSMSNNPSNNNTTTLPSVSSILADAAEMVSEEEQQQQQSPQWTLTPSSPSNMDHDSVTDKVPSQKQPSQKSIVPRNQSMTENDSSRRKLAHKSPIQKASAGYDLQEYRPWKDGTVTPHQGCIRTLDLLRTRLLDPWPEDSIQAKDECTRILHRMREQLNVVINLQIHLRSMMKNAPHPLSFLLSIRHPTQVSMELLSALYGPQFMNSSTFKAIEQLLWGGQNGNGGQHAQKSIESSSSSSSLSFSPSTSSSLSSSQQPSDFSSSGPNSHHNECANENENLQSHEDGLFELLP